MSYKHSLMMKAQYVVC